MKIVRYSYIPEKTDLNRPLVYANCCKLVETRRSDVSMGYYTTLHSYEIELGFHGFRSGLSCLDEEALRTIVIVAEVP